MKILIAGMDGYLGWPLSLRLAAHGHTVAGIDAGLRRSWVREVGSHSVIPIASLDERLRAFETLTKQPLKFWSGDLCDYFIAQDSVRAFQPDAIVHLAEMPSAAYSMIDADHAVYAQRNNIIGTLNLLHAIRDEQPSAHLVKLGTMGEYGTPNVQIPEGFFEIEYMGRKDRLPFPRQAGSWYHQSKVHDSNNIMMACKIWNLRSTDIMQGVVYGTRDGAPAADPRFRTRFDFDQCFGTAINRFCAQAVADLAIMPFGSGRQRRVFLPLKDSITCIELALEHPPKMGEYRVINQFEETYEIIELARRVQAAAKEFGISAPIVPVENPRVESESHYYEPQRQILIDWGYNPTRDMAGELRGMFEDLAPHKDRIVEKLHVICPDIRWGGEKKICESLLGDSQ
jgi:UDP-sulfoquinovose synthase